MGKAIKIGAGLAVAAAAAGGGYVWAQNEANARADAAWNAFVAALPEDVEASYDSRAVALWTRSATLGGVRIVFPETGTSDGANVEIAQVVATDLKDNGHIADFALTDAKLKLQGEIDPLMTATAATGRIDDMDFTALASLRSTDSATPLALSLAAAHFEDVQADIDSGWTATAKSASILGLADGRIERFEVDGGAMTLNVSNLDGEVETMSYKAASYGVGPLDFGALIRLTEGRRWTEPADPDDAFGSVERLARDEQAEPPAPPIDVAATGVEVAVDGLRTPDGAMSFAITLGSYEQKGYDTIGLLRAVQREDPMALLTLSFGSWALRDLAFRIEAPRGSFDVAIESVDLAHTAEGRFGGLTVQGYSTKIDVERSEWEPGLTGESRLERFEIGPIDVAAIAAAAQAEAYADILAASGFTHFRQGPGEDSYKIVGPRDEGSVAVKLSQGASGLTVERDGDAVTAIDLKIADIVFAGDFSDMEEVRTELAPFGAEIFEASLNFALRVDFAKRLFTTDLEVGLDKGGELDAHLAFGSIPRLEEMASMPAFQTAMAQTTFDRFELTYAEEALVGRMFDYVAAQHEISRDAVVARTVDDLRELLGGEGKEIVGTIEFFLKRPGVLTVSAKPPAPIPAAAFVAAMASPALALENLNVTVTATPPAP